MNRSRIVIAIATVGLTLAYSQANADIICPRALSDLIQQQDVLSVRRNQIPVQSSTHARILSETDTVLQDMNHAAFVMTASHDQLLKEKKFRHFATENGSLGDQDSEIRGRAAHSLKLQVSALIELIKSIENEDPNKAIVIQELGRVQEQLRIAIDLHKQDEAGYWKTEAAIQASKPVLAQFSSDLPTKIHTVIDNNLAELNDSLAQRNTMIADLEADLKWIQEGLENQARALVAGDHSAAGAQVRKTLDEVFAMPFMQNPLRSINGSGKSYGNYRGLKIVEVTAVSFVLKGGEFKLGVRRQDGSIIDNASIQDLVGQYALLSEQTMFSPDDSVDDQGRVVSVGLSADQQSYNITTLSPDGKIHVLKASVRSNVILRNNRFNQLNLAQNQVGKTLTIRRILQSDSGTWLYSKNVTGVVVSQTDNEITLRTADGSTQAIPVLISAQDWLQIIP